MIVDTLQRLLGKRGLRIDHQEPRDGLDSGSIVVIDADSWWNTSRDRQQGIDQLLQRIVRPAVLVFMAGSSPTSRDNVWSALGHWRFLAQIRNWLRPSPLRSLDDRFVSSAPLGRPAWKSNA